MPISAPWYVLCSLPCPDCLTCLQTMETPLHWCAKMNSTSCAKVLLDAGAELNAVDQSGSTPLHYAASAGNIEMVMILLDRGADVAVLDKDGSTAIELAADGKSTAAKAVAVVFLRHYQRIGLVASKGMKSKISSMVSAGSFHREAPVDEEDMPQTVSRSNSRQTSPARVLARVSEERRASPSAANPRALEGATHRAAIAEAEADMPTPFHFGAKAVPEKMRSRSPSIRAAETSPERRPPSPVRAVPPPKPVAPAAAVYAAPEPAPAPAPAVKRRETEMAKPAAPRISPTALQKVSAEPATRRSASKSILIMPSASSRDLFKPASIDETDDDIHNQVDAVTRKLFSSSVDAVPLVSSESMKGRRFQSASEANTSPTFLMDTRAVPEGTSNNVSEKSKARKTLSESAFPAADLLPFQPRLPGETLAVTDYLDVIVAIEHCTDCHLHNDQSLRHDAKKYVKAAISVLYGIVQAIVTNKFKVRLFAMRSAPLTVKRLGAMEVTIAICVPSIETLPAEPAPVPMFGGSFTNAFANLLNPPESKKNQVIKPKWATHKLYSKLVTKRYAYALAMLVSVFDVLCSWPTVKAMEQKAVSFLDVTIRESAAAVKDALPTLTDAAMKVIGTSSHRSPGLLSELVYGEYKHAAIPADVMSEVEVSYNAWQERMKMPVQMVRDPLDLEIPSLFPSKSVASLHKGNSTLSIELKHPQGPFLDRMLLDTCGPEEFERLVMGHFFVLDTK